MAGFESFWIILIVSCVFKQAEAIFCHQCNSTQLQGQFQCGEFFDEHSESVPTSCHNVYGAKYCIKQLGHIEVDSIKCFQCYASFNISCTDILIHDGGVVPQSCDYVFEAAYCVKTTGLYAGGVGTRRFCSSSDLGSYCNYVQQPGDILKDYRSCFFTCDTDGCNSGSQITLSIAMATTYAVVFYLTL